MAPDAAVWLVILAAVAAANLPFLSQRLFLVVRLSGGKSLALRLLELLVYYFLVGALGLLLERNAGRIAPQGWEFYAVTGALFLTLAFPGFVWRYLFKHRRRGHGTAG
ncbi:DUF2818 family protein [Pseudorhodoferax sp.]|uniref:DUF2818 family protein n=1 Tax=Pseudorhodoferax sp. TaxID=1993553 RepID=UPI0039E7046A